MTLTRFICIFLLVAAMMMDEFAYAAVTPEEKFFQLFRENGRHYLWDDTTIQQLKEVMDYFSPTEEKFEYEILGEVEVIVAEAEATSLRPGTKYRSLSVYEISYVDSTTIPVQDRHFYMRRYHYDDDTQRYFQLESHDYIPEIGGKIVLKVTQTKTFPHSDDE